ncbi:hypothetical protein GCM10022393_19080 [Aquimarina addita]|uniref:DKNYY family protein n=1 Tax=Aquimarina addita TaxID=870485 RepID=A0ABP6UIX0_9FLAO
MIKYIVWILLVPITIISQEIITPVIKIVEPTMDSLMKVTSLSECKYCDSPFFILNKTSVIYQDCNNRTVFYPDIPSFRSFSTDNKIRIPFALDKEAIYFRGVKIKTDTTGFQIIGEKYHRGGNDFLWKTKNAVYKNTKKIKVAHVKTFQATGAFWDDYFRDDFFVYYFDKKIEGSDGITVHTPIKNFTFDKNNSYLKGEIITYENKRITPVNNTFYKTSTHVLTRRNNDFILYKNADAATLKSLSKSYAIDKNHVYYLDTVLPVKREYLKNIKIWEKTNDAFLSDGQHIYYKDGNIQNELDATTFGMFANSDNYYFDKNGVYYRKWDKEIADVIHKKIPFHYKNTVHLENTIIPEKTSYIIYENQVYDFSKEILYLNLTNEQIQLAKENKLYGHIAPIEKKYSNGVTLMANIIYWKQRKTIADASTFSPIGRNYKDLNHVYMIDQTKGFSIIEGIDSNTIENFNGFTKDANYLYLDHRKIIKSKDIELLGTFTGYRGQCSIDNTPYSDYYLFKNVEGYWLVRRVYNEITIRNLGNTLGENWNTELSNTIIK